MMMDVLLPGRQRPKNPLFVFCFAILLGLWGLTACMFGGSRALDSGLTITSPAFEEGDFIPQKYTCSAENLSPPLDWSGVPAEAESLALVVDDPDAPGRTFVHWVLFDMSPDQPGLEEGASFPGGIGVHGTNGFRDTGYGGPCPPQGAPHRYFFRLYALDTKLNLPEGASWEDVDSAMRGHIIVQAELMGRYDR